VSELQLRIISDRTRCHHYIHIFENFIFIRYLLHMEHTLFCSLTLRRSVVVVSFTLFVALFMQMIQTVVWLVGRSLNVVAIIHCVSVHWCTSECELYDLVWSYCDSYRRSG